MIDKNKAVTQETLDAQAGFSQEPQEPQYKTTFEGYDEQTTEPEPPADTADEGGVAELIETPTTSQEPEEIQPETEAQTEVIDIDIDDSDVTQPDTKEPKKDGLPDWVEKLVAFSEDTGGGIEEYLNYTKDYESFDNTQLLKEYYKQTKPNYTDEDIDLILEDKYGVDELEEGDERSREDRLKLLALKDEVAIAKVHLNSGKEKYYSDMKSGVLGAPDQYKEAVEFFDNHKKQLSQNQATRDKFTEASNKVFNEEFRGFEFDSSGSKYRVKIGNTQKVMESQLDLNDVVGEFLDETGNIADVAGWHKALWSAKNSDKLFNAGIEAGKALALKERAKATKNPDYANEGPSKPPTNPSKYKFLGGDTNNF